MKHIPIEQLQVTASIVRKAELPFVNLASGKGIPTSEPIYEVEFEAEGKFILFSLSIFEFNQLEIGDSGLLVYDRYKHCNELVSFKDIIKAVSK